MVVPLNPVYSPEVFYYAINNQFLENGQKGFGEYKILENKNIFARVDFPGVPKETVRVLLNESKNALTIFAEAPKEHKNDFSHRKYGTITPLYCNCCQISSFTYSMTDGVLRLHIIKTNIDPQLSPCTSTVGCTDPYAEADSGRILLRHPCVHHGSDLAYKSKKLQNGALFVRVDMPGVPKDKFTVSISNGRVKVAGEAPLVSYDVSSRFYSGDVAALSTIDKIPLRQIKTIAKNSVIRLIIPPL